MSSCNPFVGIHLKSEDACEIIFLNSICVRLSLFVCCVLLPHGDALFGILSSYQR